MFRILKCSHDLADDSLEIKVVFQQKRDGRILDDGGFFKSRASGEAWLSQLKKDYFTTRVENYIHAQQHIIEISQGHRSLQAKKECIDILMNYLDYATRTATLYEACKYCLIVSKHLEMILPPLASTYYPNSAEDLKIIMDFAKLNAPEELKQAS